MTAIRARLPAWLALLGVVLVALNLRSPIAALAPLLPRIQSDIGLSRGAAGLLTTVPVLCFGGLATAAATLGRRLGNERALWLAMAALAAGTVVRVVPVPPGVFAGTTILGAAIAVGNVLMPSVIKAHFGARPGPVTGLYTAVLLGGAAAAAGVSAPLADAGLGWGGSLVVWVIPAVLALIVWSPAIRWPHAAAVAGTGSASVLRSVVTWALAVFMGAQSLLYFSVLAWLPSVLRDAGVAPGRADLALLLFNLLGIAAALVVPWLAARWPDQRAIAWSICVAWTVGIGGLLVAPSAFLLWAIFAGAAQGGAVSLVFTLIVLRSATPVAARGLSGTVQALGYLIGAAGPFLMGVLRDATGSWTIPLTALLGSVAIMAVSAGLAGRDDTVDVSGRAAPSPSTPSAG